MGLMVCSRCLGTSRNENSVDVPGQHDSPSVAPLHKGGSILKTPSRAWLDIQTTLDNIRPTIINPVVSLIFFGMLGVWVLYYALFNLQFRQDIYTMLRQTNFLHRQRVTDEAKLEGVKRKVLLLEQQLAAAKFEEVKHNDIPSESPKLPPVVAPAGQSQHLEVTVARERRRREELTSRASSLGSELASLQAQVHTSEASIKELETENSLLKEKLKVWNDQYSHDGA